MRIVCFARQRELCRTLGLLERDPFAFLIALGIIRAMTKQRLLVDVATRHDRQRQSKTRATWTKSAAHDTALSKVPGIETRVVE